MAVIFNKCDLPAHLFNIPELDFSEDLFADPQDDLWFRLGAWTNTPQRDDRDVEDVVSRQTIMLPPAGFSDIYDNLESIGNVLHGLGEPKGFFAGDKYGYAPFHQFELMRASLVGEPLVFVRYLQSGVELFINPDLVLYFGLEERTDRSGIWWHPERGVEALRRQIIENDNLQIIEIRVAYLLKYLRVRQMSLLVGHYRHLHLYNPSQSSCEAFVEENIVLGAPDQGAKAVFQNWGLRQYGLSEPFLQRRLHLWFEIKPPEIDTDNPWADEPPFDPYAFTLLTRYGPVAPARWKHLQQTEGREFVGQCDFMERTFFRQEVLSKYEGMSGFEVLDDGSVLCRNYWALNRSTSRIGNELLSTAIGDFAEDVPFEEWPHWKQYSVEPPSSETIRVLDEEQTVPDAINALIRELNGLNTAFENFAYVMNVEVPNPLWTGSLTSLAVRQLKRVYPTVADDDEFLTRATLLSTLVIEGLGSQSLRVLLRAISEGLHLKYDGQDQSLGSRNLLQRVVLIAALIENIQPAIAEIPTLVMQAEGQAARESGSDIHIEIGELWKKTRKDLAPLAFLYDLRLHGGITHSPNKEKVVTAAAELGLPNGSWHRMHYLLLLDLVTKSVAQAGGHLENATMKLSRDGFPIPR